MKVSFLKNIYQKGAVYNVAAVTVWKLGSFFNSVLIAAFFGAQAATDVYFYLAMLAGFAANFFAGVNTSVLIPEAMHMPEPKRQAFLNRALVFYVLFGLLCACAAAASPRLLGLISRFPPGPHHAVFVWSAVYLAAVLICQFLVNILETKSRFEVALLSPLNAFVPLFLLIFWGKKMGVTAMLVGFTAAYLSQALFCLCVMIFKLRWNFTLRSPEKFSRSFGSAAAGAAALEGVNFLSGMLPVFLMSGFGAGIVSALNFAKQLFDTPTEIFTNKIIGVSRLQFNSLSAHKKYSALDRSYQRVFLILMLIMTPVCVFTTAFARDIVSVFFGHGIMDAESLRSIGVFTSLFMPSILLLIPSYIQRALLSSVKKIKEFVPWQIFISAFFAALVLLFMRGRPYGYPAAFFTSNFIWLGLAYFMMKRLLPFINYLKSLKVMAQTILLNILALLPALWLAKFMNGAFLKCLVCGILFVGLSALMSVKYYKMKI